MILLLFLGVSGVGKTTLMQEICRRDKRFFQLSVFTTRKQRVGEQEKISVEREEILRLRKKGRVGPISEFSGHLYAPNFSCLRSQKACDAIGMLDWPYNRLEEISHEVECSLLAHYLAPESHAQVAKHLQTRDQSLERLLMAEKELKLQETIEHDARINSFWVVRENGTKNLAREVIQDVETTLRR